MRTLYRILLILVLLIYLIIAGAIFGIVSIYAVFHYIFFGKKILNDTIIILDSITIGLLNKLYEG